MHHERESARLHALQQLGLLDTPPGEAFDRITRIAAKIFRLPAAAIFFTDSDRHWFKSRFGLETLSIPRGEAPDVTETGQALAVPDLLADPRFCESGLSREGLRFYAGAPLNTRQGFCLGAICVLGREPKWLDPSEIIILGDLAALVIAQIELQQGFGRIDSVSGLPNRSQFADDLDDLARNRPGERRYVVLIDLANSEQLNSTIRVAGPSYVDDMINEAVREILKAIGPQRRVYHAGPTQFALLSLPDQEEGRYVALLAATLAVVREKAVSRFVTTTAIGAVGFILGETSPADLLRMAYGAAQEARTAETRVSLYSAAQDARHHRRFTLVNEFGAALDSASQLSLVFQPRIDLVSGLCAGAEALLRWNHPTLGNIPPGEFIPLIERTPLVRTGTAFVIDAALKQLAIWRAAGVAPARLSINVSPANLLERDFTERVIAGLDRYRVPPGLLELEVTESIFLNDADQALATLKSLSAFGIRLAIDDFGTGYSSLSYLQRLPAQVVKIDQSFVCNLVGDPGKQAVISAIVSLAHQLDYRVVAEGIETDEMLKFIIGIKCQEAQGDLFGPPMRPETFIGWARNWDDARRIGAPAVPGRRTRLDELFRREALHEAGALVEAPQAGS